MPGSCTETYLNNICRDYASGCIDIDMAFDAFIGLLEIANGEEIRSVKYIQNVESPRIVTRKNGGANSYNDCSYGIDLYNLKGRERHRVTNLINRISVYVKETGGKNELHNIPTGNRRGIRYGSTKHHTEGLRGMGTR